MRIQEEDDLLLISKKTNYCCFIEKDAQRQKWETILAAPRKQFTKDYISMVCHYEHVILKFLRMSYKQKSDKSINNILTLVIRYCCIRDLWFLINVTLSIADGASISQVVRCCCTKAQNTRSLKYSRPYRYCK